MMSMACSCSRCHCEQREAISAVRQEIASACCARLAMTKSHPLRIEYRFLPRPVAAQRALVADRVGPLEDPVLPGGETGEDFRFHGLGSAEAQIGFHAGEGVGREARAFLQEDADLVLPIDVVERKG